MTIIGALTMRPMHLVVVIRYPAVVLYPHVFPCFRLFEVKISHSSLYVKKHKEELNLFASKATLDFDEQGIHTAMNTVTYVAGGFIIVIHEAIEDEMGAFIAKYEDELTEIGSKATLNYDRDTGAMSASY